MAAENQDTGSLLPVSTAAGASGGVGLLLRETREKQGRDLATVATDLRIRQPYLQAIEDGRFENLPGATYAVGFVRGYAEHLGLDSEEIVRRFKQENSDFANRHELVFPAAVSEGSIPTGALLLFAILAAAFAYGAWYWYQSRESSVAEAVPPLPERLAALIHRPVGGSGTEVVPVGPAEGAKPAEAPVAQTAAMPAPAVPAVPVPSSSAMPPAAAPAPAAQPSAAPSAAQRIDVVPPAEDESPAAAPTVAAPAPAAPAPATSSAVASAAGPTPPAPAVPAPAASPAPATPAPVAAAPAAVPAPAAPSPDAAPAPAAAMTGGDMAAAPGQATETPAAPTYPSRVTLQAGEDCWIQIRDANGQVIYSRLLRKGASYFVPDQPGLTLTAGNSAALTWMLDGKPVRAGKGKVRRNMSLDPEHLGRPMKVEKAAGEPTAPISAPAAPASVAAPVAPAGGAPTE